MRGRVGDNLRTYWPLTQFFTESLAQRSANPPAQSSFDPIILLKIRRIGSRL